MDQHPDPHLVHGRVDRAQQTGEFWGEEAKAGRPGRRIGVDDQLALAQAGSDAMLGEIVGQHGAKLREQGLLRADLELKPLERWFALEQLADRFGTVGHVTAASLRGVDVVKGTPSEVDRLQSLRE